MPLWQHMLVGKRLFDLFDYRAEPAGLPANRVVDPELVRHIAHRREADRLTDWQPRRAADRWQSRGPAPVLPAARRVRM